MSKSKRIKLTVELNTGETHDIVVGNPSLVAWDRYRAARDLPTAVEAPNMWMTFVAWHHMKAAQLVSCSLDEFETTVCVAIDDTEEPAEEGDEIGLPDPTRPAPLDVGP